MNVVAKRKDISREEAAEEGDDRLGSYRDVLSDSHNHVQIVATAINSQILSFCNEKSRKREIATKSCGSEILATLRHVQSSISSLTPYSLFLHFTILLLI